MFACERCGYSVKNVCDLKKHLKRKLLCKSKITDVDVAIQLAELCIKKDDKDFKCKYCDKSYNQQPSRSRHERSCIKNDCKNKNCKIQKAETIYNTKYNTNNNTNNNTTIENQIVNNIETQNNVILNFNGFGQETITHIIEDPEFFNKIKELITKYEEVPALLQMYVMLLLDPKNRNLILEKLNSRYIQTHDETGKIINKTKTECYNNSMLPLKEIFIIGGSRLYNDALNSGMLGKIYYTHINQSFDCDNFVEPILNRDDMTYEVLNKIKYDKVDIENSTKIYSNIELTFYLITKN